MGMALMETNTADVEISAATPIEGTTDVLVLRMEDETMRIPPKQY